MYLELEQDQRWIQIAIVQGGVRDCGDFDFPGIYTRLGLNFIRLAINTLTVPKTGTLRQ